MEISGKKILVIGGAGFIGSHVVSELLRTSVGEVVVFDNYARGKRDNIRESLEDSRCSVFADGGDIRETDVLAKAVEESDAVIHLAAMWLLHCKDYPRTAFDVNVSGTFNVLEACAKYGTEKLIYSSSASVYGDAVDVPMTEEHPFNNRNLYGATKIAGEALCRAFFDRYGLNYVGLRYMNVYGPHQDQTAAYTGVIPIMLNKIEANEAPIINGDGSQAYDFVTAQDVARCNIQALVTDATDEFYNVGTGVQTSIKELCDLILLLTGSDLKVSYNPYNEEDARRLVQNRIGCPEKAKKDLHFEYQDDLKTGLLNLISWRTQNRGRY
jgi:UDP-glucose 4-epimerase